jgi:methionine-rich copper-binding protein CopC
VPFVAALIGLVAFTLDVGPILAHDEIESSNPPTGSIIDDPISTVEINFGEEISDEVSLFLTFDKGDADIEEIGGTTTKVGETTARLDFDPIEREGRYFVQYLAPVPADGHVLAGAISFTYGKPNQSDFPWLPFAGVSAVILGLGGWFSYRRMLVATVDEPATAADPDPSDPT